LLIHYIFVITGILNCVLEFWLAVFAAKPKFQGQKVAVLVSS
jgi:hypothetical protein